MITFKFDPWKLDPHKDVRVIRRWMNRVANEATDAFISGIKGQHSGRVYRRRGVSHQASAPGEFPASDSGQLLSSVRARATKDTATVGTSAAHAIYLRQGTARMARRRMSDDALEMGIDAARKENTGWVRWKRNR